MLLARVLVLVALAACGDDAPPDARSSIVGDPTQPAQLEPIYRTADGEMAPLVDGTELPLLTPPQGGKVAFVGVRAFNVDLDGITLQVALREPCGGRVVGIERRPIAWRIADDGFAEPAQPEEISDYANVPACPNAGAVVDLDGQPHEVELRLYEAGRMTEAIVAVTPTCGSDTAPQLCRCECDSDYELGAECPSDPDAGVGCP